MLLQNSTSTWTHLIAALTGLLTSGGIWAFITSILNRNKHRSETAKLDAGTRATKVETYIKEAEHLLQRLNLLEAADLERERDFQSAQRYYRAHQNYHEQLDLAYRNRSHVINGEWARLVLKVRELEARLADKGDVVEPMRLKTQDQVAREFPLPKFPETD